MKKTFQFLKKNEFGIKVPLPPSTYENAFHSSSFQVVITFALEEDILRAPSQPILELGNRTVSVVMLSKGYRTEQSSYLSILKQANQPTNRSHKHCIMDLNQ